MSSCRESIEDYLYAQEKIKKNMSKLKDECPDKVLRFMLKRESTTTITPLHILNAYFTNLQIHKLLSSYQLILLVYFLIL